MKTRRSRTKLDAMSQEALDAAFPSARYFQVHFEYLHETISDLKQQIHCANQQIAGLQQQLQAVGPDGMPTANYVAETPPIAKRHQS